MVVTEEERDEVEELVAERQGWLEWASADVEFGVSEMGADVLITCETEGLSTETAVLESLLGDCSQLRSSDVRLVKDPPGEIDVKFDTADTVNVRFKSRSASVIRLTVEVDRVVIFEEEIDGLADLGFLTRFSRAGRCAIIMIGERRDKGTTSWTSVDSVVRLSFPSSIVTIGLSILSDDCRIDEEEEESRRDPNVSDSASLISSAGMCEPSTETSEASSQSSDSACFTAEVGVRLGDMRNETFLAASVANDFKGARVAQCTTAGGFSAETDEEDDEIGVRLFIFGPSL